LKQLHTHNYFSENSNELLQSRLYYLIALVLDTQTGGFLVGQRRILLFEKAVYNMPRSDCPNSCPKKG